MRNILYALLLFSTTALAVDLSFSGWTNPKTYLGKFPLGKVTQQEVLKQLGVPKQSVTLAGVEYWSYPITNGDRVPTYTFQIKDGKVIDVQYNNPNALRTYDGLTASEVQKHTPASK